MENEKHEPLVSQTVSARIDALPVGTVVPFAGNDETAADLSGIGWFLCNGATLGRNDFPVLYDILGYTCGGKGLGFCVPDLRGVFLRGVDVPAGDAGTHRDPDADKRTSHTSNEEKAPNKVLSRQVDALKSHKHNIPNGPVYVDTITVGASLFDQSPPTLYLQRFDRATKEIILPTLDTGGKDTRPVNVSVNYIIFAGLPRNKEQLIQQAQPA